MIGRTNAKFMGDSPENWESMRRFVRAGVAPKITPVGTKLKTLHSIHGEIIWTVLGHDHDVNPLDPTAHTMRIGMDAVIYPRVLNALSALYYCENGLTGGTYHLNFPHDYYPNLNGDKTVQFTLTKNIPAGGVITFPWPGGQQVTNTKVATYATAAATTAIESNRAVTIGADGTNLGTADGNTPNLNHIDFVRFGSSNYGISNIRQWLNSEEAANAWFSPQTLFNRPPNYITTPGFLAGFGSDFLSAIIPVDIRTARSSIIQEQGVTGGSYLSRDKMFIPSSTEVFGSNNGGIAEGAILPYYDGAANADRIKFDISNQTTPRIWWLRSPVLWETFGYYVVEHTGGSSDTWYWGNNNGASPHCVIG